jgi:hypothetical protein
MKCNQQHVQIPEVHRETGIHSGPAPILLAGCWSGKEFESTPGHSQVGPIQKKPLKMPVMKSIR